MEHRPRRVNETDVCDFASYRAFGLEGILTRHSLHSCCLLHVAPPPFETRATGSPHAGHLSSGPSAPSASTRKVFFSETKSFWTLGKDPVSDTGWTDRTSR
jgi:hypothetical protein